MPTSDQLSASSAAAAIKRFITKIRALNDVMLNDTSILRQHAEEYRTKILPATIKLLDIIHLVRQYDSKPFENFYYLYFLQQVSRFNQFFNIIEKITDDNEPGAVINASGETFSKCLINAGIHPIHHYAFPQLSATKMSVTLRKSAAFREHYEYEYRKFYNPKTTPDNEPHQDLAHYYKANVRIGGATQKSNLSRLFSSHLSQQKDEYFKPADAKKHALEKALYTAAIAHIHNGSDLTAEEVDVLRNGEYYRFPIPHSYMVEAYDAKQEDQHERVTHLGHASELIDMPGATNLMVAIDPVNYQSGTEGFIVKYGAKLAYPRKTAAALASEDYPATQVVLLTHNHHDHMCMQSLTEAFSPHNTLFIVPKGDGRRMREQGLLNVLEFKSWNDYAEIQIKTAEGSLSHYVIHAFPAKHASNRFTNDLYKSLYMGFMLRNKADSGYVLCTGDTGVLDQQHYDNLSVFLQKNNAFIRTACIASGPDRPRQWMECTHQSTADAITMHAKINVINAQITGLQDNYSAKAIGYHQGCFRLGLLSLQDVRCTVLRMLSVIRTLPNLLLKDIDQETIEKNMFYHFMDNFEQTALVATLRAYQQLDFLTTKNVYAMITQQFYVPQPGASAIASSAFHFDYEKLIQNRDPLATNVHHINKPYEFFALHIPPDLYRGTPLLNEIVQDAISSYLKRNLTRNSSKTKKLKAFYREINYFEDLPLALSHLYIDIFPKQDEGQRDEGHVHTMLTIIAGLIHFPEFREQFYARHIALTTAKLNAAPGLRA